MAARQTTLKGSKKTTKRKTTKKKAPAKRKPQAKKKTGTKRPRTIKVSRTQTGSTTRVVDKKPGALPPGRRISKSGKKYTERRRNRSDKSKEKGL